MMLGPRAVGDRRFAVFKMCELKSEKIDERNFNAKAHKNQPPVITDMPPSTASH